MRSMWEEIGIAAIAILVVGVIFYLALPPLITWSERIRVRADVAELRVLGVLPDSTVAIRINEDKRHE